MKKIVIATAILVCSWGLAGSAVAQQTDQAIGQVLQSVEQNNATLAARRNLTDAQRLEARTGNSLENPDVEFGYKWGNPSSLGKSGEVSLTQGFDFPSTYVYRNRMAKRLGEQYGHEYAAYRQQLLLDAQSLCLEIIALRQQNDLLRKALENAERIADIMAQREEAGDANILEANKARYELVGAKNAYKLNEIELATAENKLVNLNGGKPITFTATGFPSRPTLASQEQMRQRYEETSPELLALLSGKSAAEQDVKLSRSQSLPRLSAGYKHEFAPGGNERFNGISVGMSIPMFGNRNNVKRAKAQSLYAQSQYQSGVIEMQTALAEMYAKAELLSGSLREYRDITEHASSMELLTKAIESGQISVTDYYAELQPIYDAYLTMVEVERDFHMVCAQINMIDL